MTVKGDTTALLDQKYQDLGYSLEEDEDVLEVKLKSITIGRFAAHGVSMPTINEFIKHHNIANGLEDWQLHQGRE
jgi:hypothetical protein